MASGHLPNPLNYLAPTPTKPDEVARKNESATELPIVLAAVALVILVPIAVALYFNRWR